MQRTHTRTVNLTFSALMTALAIILSYFPEIPLAFFAPWLKLDFSFAPLMLLGFSVGPLMMVVALLVTNVVHILGGTTGGIGELANLLLGLSLLLPPTLIYRRKRTRARAVYGMGIGIVLMVLMGVLSNRYIMLPVYFPGGFEAGLQKFGLSLNAYLFGAIVPFNLIKGLINSLIVFVLYKRLSILMKEVDDEERAALKQR
ncbi:MAG TPA: ECF transporter S component [Clostridia bacterium]|jgi:riboflavin transporter FmnP|nr:ECF transporter S component [Clostridia bacterium]HPY43470.1 ECF transporter S component [Clostridia bacterium]HQA96447.1 ECF transporter S component [Clostridia bacterium]HQO55449.1 ECF transporter S component [Clostridia bacterium]